jgi:hypothetical protein
MNKSIGKLRLGPLPRNESVKLTVTLSVELKETLDRYAAVHSREHGESVDMVALIPHMLNAFIARDRGFKAMCSAGHAVRQPLKKGLNVPPLPAN